MDVQITHKDECPCYICVLKRNELKIEDLISGVDAEDAARALNKLENELAAYKQTVYAIAGVLATQAPLLTQNE